MQNTVKNITERMEEFILEKILLFQVEDATAIKAIARPLHIRVESVDISAYKETLNNLYAGKRQTEDFSGDIPAGSLIVFCNLPDKTLDKILAAIKNRKIPIDYKAIMTPTNARWNILRIYFEMAREKRAYGVQKRV